MKVTGRTLMLLHVLCVLLARRTTTALDAVDPSPHWKSTLADSPGGCPRPKLGAVVFPQYHRDPTNDLLWGDGYTEWVALNNSNDPLLPRPVPPLNYYDMTDDNTVEIQAEMARSHGISAFFYYHYWFKDGRRALDAPVARILEKKTPRFPFALVWAMASWSPRWHGPNQTGVDSDDLNFPKQEITEENVRNHVKYLETVWSDERYVRIDGRPLFIVHSGSFESFEGVDIIMKVMKESPMNPYVGVTIRNPRPMTTVGKSSPSLFSMWKDKLAKVVSPFDFGIVWEPRTISISGTFDMYCDTAVCDAKNLHMEAMHSTAPELAKLDWELSAFAGFDNLARHPSAQHLAVRIMTNQSRTGRDRSEELARLLSNLNAVSGAGRPAGRKCSNFIAINAWNEWGEGNVLEPNNLLGNRMLEATKAFADGAGPRPEGALLESCNKVRYGIYNPESKPDIRWLRDYHRVLNEQLDLWRTRHVPSPPRPHLDNWQPPLEVADKSNVGNGVVFVIGMHKSGTTSLNHALQMLGYNVFQLDLKGFEGGKRCFVENAFVEAEDGVLFNHMNRRKLLYCLKQEGIFEMHNGFQDTPFYGLVTQLIHTFKEARFVYLKRDIDDWLESVEGHFLLESVQRYWGTTPTLTQSGDWIKSNILDAVHGTMYGQAHSEPRTEDDKLVWMAGYTQQLAETLSQFTRPGMEDKILVMDLHAGDGFELLGPFLGRPDAVGWRIPYKNTRQTHQQTKRAVRAGQGDKQNLTN